MEHNASNQSFKDSFRFQSSQQKKLYSQLRLLGPGPATFYREACNLISLPQQFESTTHLVAHLLREIESSVRRVLLPYDYVPPDACSECGNRSEAHAKQIEKIVQSLGLDISVQKKWKEVATRSKSSNGLASMAHRDDLSHPRGIDTSFLKVISAFEEVFCTVLTAFEKQCTHIFAQLDTLILKEIPSKSDLSSFKNTIPHNDATHRYFFERLQSPAWLDPLYKAGLFALPPSKEWDEDLGRFIFSLWTPAQYLLRIATVESTQQTILAILQEVSDTDNPFIQRAILQITQLLPPPLAAKLVPSIQKWIQNELVQTVDFIQISNLINYLTGGGESDLAIALLESCFTILRNRESYTERWDYESLLTTNMPLLVKHSAAKTLSMLCQLLTAEVFDNYIRFRSDQKEQDEQLKKEAQEASTKSWQRTIGNARHKRLPGMHELTNLLVVALWQAAEQAIQEQLLSMDTVVSLLEENSGRIFRRITLYILSRFPQESPRSVERYLMNRTLFGDSDGRYEYGLLVQTGFSLLSEEVQNQWFEWVEAGPDLQAYQGQYEKYYHTQPNDDLVQQYVHTWQRDWLREIGDNLKEDRKEHYAALVAELGPTEPEEDLPLLTWGFSTRDPLIEELRAMSIDQILAYLREWQPSGDFIGPSREELGRLLTGVINTDPGKFAEHAHQFQGHNPIYVSAVLQGFTDAVRNQHTFKWENVLNLCQWVINQRYTLSEDGLHQIYDPAWAWACQIVANLILIATEAEPAILPILLSTQVWNILKPLTDDPDLDQEYEINEQNQDRPMEYATRAINSIRGVALHAVITYAWWLKSQAKHDENTDDLSYTKAISEIQAVLERHLDPKVDTSLAVRSIYGQRLPNLVALDKQWVITHLINLFPAETALQTSRIVAWNTYILFNKPFIDVFMLLQGEYRSAIERLDTATPGNSIIEDPNYQLGEHLIQFYWSGLIALNSTESLLTHFFMKASDILRGQVLASIGRAFYHTGEATPPEIIEHSQLLWEWRVSVAQPTGQVASYKHELAAFGWWFRADICPPEWGLHQLETALILAGYVELSYAVVERLAQLVVQYPAQVIRCLEWLVKGDTMMWTTSTWNKAVRFILVTALQCGVDETQRGTKNVISWLALHGMTDFLDLLPRKE